MAEKSKTGKIIAMVVFIGILAVIGYLAYKKWGKKSGLLGAPAIPTNDPLINAARAAYERDMINWLRSGSNPSSNAYQWYQNIGTNNGERAFRTPTNDELLAAIRYEAYKGTSEYIYTDSAGVIRWRGPSGQLYGG